MLTPEKVFLGKLSALGNFTLIKRKLREVKLCKAINDWYKINFAENVEKDDKWLVPKAILFFSDVSRGSFTLVLLHLKYSTHLEEHYVILVTLKGKYTLKFYLCPLSTEKYTEFSA